MAIDILDLAVVLVLLVATTAYFTKGSLWGKSDTLDKYAAGLGGNKPIEAGARDIIQKLAKNNKEVIVFYGSQTGTAEDYASRLAKEASQRYGLKTMIADVEDYDFENLDALGDDKVVAFVMATYGEGEPTDNAVSFWEFITDESVSFSENGDADSQPLQNLSYVIFGLGNNTYEHYNFIGRELDKTLNKLGAHRIGPYGEGDDGKGTMEEDYLAWKDEVFNQWSEEKGLSEREAVFEPSLEVTEIDTETAEAAEAASVYLGEKNKKHFEGKNEGPFNATNPFLAPVVTTRELFNSSERNCIHAEFDIGDNGLKYTTGDHLALWTQNSEEEVERFLKIFGLYEKRDQIINVKTLDPTAKVPFPVPTTYDTVVRYYLEINGHVSRQFVSSIAPFAPSEEVKKKSLLVGTDKNLFAAEVTTKCLNIARLLAQLSNGAAWNVPFAFVIETVNHLIPRYYSISSSSFVNKSIISITAVVESEKPLNADHVLKGVATNYILDLKREASGESRDYRYKLEGPRDAYKTGNVTRVPIHVRHSNFKLPSNPKKPVIMVGPGTGIAPFRGFIHERAKQAANGAPVGRSVLFFGCRRSNEDNLYADEWVSHTGEGGSEDGYDQSNFLRVHSAFSRDGPEKVYVQHKMLEQAKEINDLLKQGAFFYVCGDAQRMARDVQNTLAKIISEQRSIPIERAESIVKNMKTQNTYQEDVW